MIRVTRMRGTGPEEVDAWETCSPYFAITNSVNGGRFTLTHIRTGFASGHANSHKSLRLLAGILGALPVPWDKIRSSKALAKHWTKMPIEIQQWRRDYMNSIAPKGII